MIVLTSPAEMVEISELLQSAGFRLGDEAVEANLGIRSRLMPIAGGGFIELASEVSPGSFPHGNPFASTPRVASIFYTTDDAAADIARWRSLPEGSAPDAPMVQAGSWRRLDGTMGYFIGLTPTPPTTIFFGLREIRLFPLPYPEDAETAPALQRVTVSGSDAIMWRRQHAELFSLPDSNGTLRAGRTEIAFDQTEQVEAQITVTFGVPNPEVTIPLVAGRFEFVPVGAG